MEVAGGAQRRFFVCFNLNIFGEKQRIIGCYIMAVLVLI